MKFEGKKNRILACLRKGEVPLGMQVSIPDPAVIEVLAHAGFDFFMLCMEHARIGGERLEHCIRAADAAGITTIVRVPDCNPSIIRDCVEAGAQGIVVPHVRNRADARAAIDAVRYPPEGRLGMCPYVRAAHYSKETWNEYLEHSARETMVFLLLEGREAIDNAEEILDELKPGVDAVGVGRGDLAQDIARPGEKVDFRHPYLAEAHRRVLTLAEQRGLPMMDMPWPNYDLADAKRVLSLGVKIMLYNVDLFVFYGQCQEIARAVKGAR